MPENEAVLQNEVRIKGAEIACELFGALVDEAIGGVQPFVDINWNDGVDDFGEPMPKPEVTVNGQSAFQFGLAMQSESEEDQAVKEQAAIEFNDMLACLWDDTIQYYKELDELSEDLGILALPGTDFYERAKAAIAARGPEVVNQSHRETMRVARELACADLAIWSQAVEAAEVAANQKEGQTMARHIFERLVYTHLLGEGPSVEISQYTKEDSTEVTEVMIGGKTAEAFACQLLNYLVTNSEALEAGYESFVDLMVNKWQEAVTQ